MKISAIRPEQLDGWASFHDSLLQFIRKYSSGQISTADYRKLQRLTPRSFLRPGTGILQAEVMTEDGSRTAGILCVCDYGSALCTIVVHPLYRRHGIGTRLLKTQLAQNERFGTAVASGNLAALKMCFNAGLTAYGARLAAAGNPELLLSKNFESKEGGNSAAARIRDSYALFE